MYQKIKEHVQEHKVVYSCIATGVLSAGITCLLMRGRYAAIAGRTETSVFVRPLSILSNGQTTNTIINVVEREGRGHPGYMTACIETGEKWASQGLAAIANDVTPNDMSMHLRGKLPDVNGLHFEHVAA